MVIEEFLDGSPEAVYARLAEKGRMIPEGVEYVEILFAGQAEDELDPFFLEAPNE